RDMDGAFRVTAGKSDDAESLEALRAIVLPATAAAPMVDRLRGEGLRILAEERLPTRPPAGLTRRHGVRHLLILPLRKGDDIAGMHTVVFRGSAPPAEPTTTELRTRTP